MGMNLVPVREATADMIIGPSDIVSSYDTGTPEGKLALYRAVQGSDFQLDDCVGREIDVANIVIHWISRTDIETGEATDGIRGVLIGADGTRYGTGSRTAIADAMRPAAMFGLSVPYDPPLRFRVVKTRSRTPNRSYLQLEMV